MKLQQLRFFVAVYERGSFSSAAERVNATQSGLSMHVSQLEKRHGVQLFDRGPQGVTPTEAGRRFYDEAVRVLAAASRAEDRIKSLSGNLTDHIRVGLMPTFTRAVLSPALLRFTRSFPEVRVSIAEAYSGVLARQVADGQLDFAVVPAFDGSAPLTGVGIGVDRECLVLSAHSELQLGEEAVLSRLQPLRLVLPSRENVRRLRIETYLAVNGIEVAEILELDSMHGTLDIVANSDWVTILPGVLCLPDLAIGPRRVVPLAQPPLDVNYFRIAPRSRPMGAAATAFATVLQEELDAALLIRPVSRVST